VSEHLWFLGAAGGCAVTRTTFRAFSMYNQARNPKIGKFEGGQRGPNTASLFEGCC
jgi:hypothetical protein